MTTNPRMRKAKGPGLMNVYHVTAPKGFVIDDVMWGSDGKVVTIAYRQVIE